MPPAFWQQVQLHWSWRQLNANYLGRARQDALDGVTQLITGLVQQHVRKRRVNALQFSAQSQLWQFQLQFFPVRAFKSSGKAELAVLSYGGNKRLAFRINKKCISLRRISARTLRSIYRHLLRDITALQQRRRDLGKLFVSNRDGRYHTSALGLLDNLNVSCHFVSRERQRLLNLDSNHFWKLRRIDGGQTKSLGKHSGNWQAKPEIVGRP